MPWLIFRSYHTQAGFDILEFWIVSDADDDRAVSGNVCCQCNPGAAGRAGAAEELSVPLTI